MNSILRALCVSPNRDAFICPREYYMHVIQYDQQITKLKCQTFSSLTKDA